MFQSRIELRLLVSNTKRVNTQQKYDDLKNYSFFSGFPEHELRQFAELAEPVGYSDGSAILVQGKPNECLYFLKSGKLEVQVDGETVAVLNEPGEVVGEMSIISRKEAVASVIARGPVETYRVGSTLFEGLPKKDQEQIQHLLFRVYSGILTSRLQDTNDKAKKFEITNRDLVIAQERLQKTNDELEEEITRRSQETVNKIQTLIDNRLQPSIQLLNSHFGQKSEVSQKVVEDLSTVVDFLKPLVDMTKKINSPVSRVLLLDADRGQQKIAALALGGTGVQLDAIGSLDDLGPFEEKNYDLILCSVEQRELIQGLREGKRSEVPIVILMNLDTELYLDTLLKYPEVKYFVSRDTENRSFTVKNITTTVSKIVSKDLYGLEKYLNWGAHIEERKVGDSSARRNATKQMTDYFDKIGLRKTYLSRLGILSEEMLMNAIYDAPTDKEGRSLFNHLPRTEEIILEKGQEATLRYGSDGVFVGVSVIDPFGGLSKEIIMHYLESCYRGRAGSLNENKGGAGRGLHMIIETSDLTIFNVDRMRRTEVISLINIEKRAGELKPSFHLFYS